MKQLWLRIFIYTVTLLAIMQLATFALHNYSLDKDELRRYMFDNIRNAAAVLEGESLAGAKTAAALLGQRGGRVWVLMAQENGQEAVLAGNKDFSRASLEADAKGRYWNDGELELWQSANDRRRFIAAAPVRLSDAEATLYVSYGQPHGPRLWNIFMRGVIGFSIVGFILAFWLARRVSRPLRRLRGEVLEIAGGSLERRVEPKGPDEVRDVALAVNYMADSLAKYIRNMRELVANISHELRSPLARMQVSLALLEEKIGGGADEKTLTQLRLLNEEMGHMNKLIGDTLLSSKLDLHGSPPLTEPVAFSDLAGEMLRRHAPLMEKRGLKLETELQENVNLPGDETLLCNLVSNYLDNAAKYTVDNGAVRARLFTEADKAVFEVENTHAPISPEVLEQLFEPFYRGGIATGGGVGLGLSLVRQIAALHQGGVEATNTENGVCFRVYLPLKHRKQPGSKPE